QGLLEGGLHCGRARSAAQARGPRAAAAVRSRPGRAVLLDGRGAGPVRRALPPRPRTIMRVLAWVPYPLGIAPAQRYRIEQWAPYLRELGIEVTFQPFATPELNRALYRRGEWPAKVAGMAAGLGRRFAEALQAARYDAVFLQREGS